MAVPSYDELEAGWKELRRSHGLHVREVACVGAERTLLLAEFGPVSAPAVTLASGVHGDEPAAPWALLSIVRDGLLDRRFRYRIWPCTNPSGYRRGTRENAEGDDINRSFSGGGTTPESRAIITATRDRRFALSLDLHEDFESDGFYCYEPFVAHERQIGPCVIDALDDAGIPIHEFSGEFDIGYPTNAEHLRQLERGRVVPDADLERAYFKGLPYNLYLVRRVAERTLTFESPRWLAWETRIEAHRIATVTALTALADSLAVAG